MSKSYGREYAPSSSTERQVVAKSAGKGDRCSVDLVKEWSRERKECVKSFLRAVEEPARSFPFCPFYDSFQARDEYLNILQKNILAEFASACEVTQRGMKIVGHPGSVSRGKAAFVTGAGIGDHRNSIWKFLENRNRDGSNAAKEGTYFWVEEKLHI